FTVESAPGCCTRLSCAAMYSAISVSLMVSGEGGSEKKVGLSRSLICAILPWMLTGVSLLKPGRWMSADGGQISLTGAILRLILLFLKSSKPEQGLRCSRQ